MLFVAWSISRLLSQSRRITFPLILRLYSTNSLLVNSSYAFFQFVLTIRFKLVFLCLLYYLIKVFSFQYLSQSIVTSFTSLSFLYLNLLCSCQSTYTCKRASFGGNKWTRTINIIAYVVLHFSLQPYGCLVGTSGLEPPTSRLSGVCSNQLSYVPVLTQKSVFVALITEIWSSTTFAQRAFNLLVEWWR